MNDKTYQVTVEYKRYPMCADQAAQIDCRVAGCVFQEQGACCNVSPALTINPNGTVICWSMATGLHLATMEVAKAEAGRLSGD